VLTGPGEAPYWNDEAAGWRDVAILDPDLCTRESGIVALIELGLRSPTFFALDLYRPQDDDGVFFAIENLGPIVRATRRGVAMYEVRPPLFAKAGTCFGLSFPHSAAAIMYTHTPGKQMRWRYLQSAMRRWPHKHSQIVRFSRSLPQSYLLRVSIARRPWLISDRRHVDVGNLSIVGERVLDTTHHDKHCWRVARSRVHKLAGAMANAAGDDVGIAHQASNLLDMAAERELLRGWCCSQAAAALGARSPCWERFASHVECCYPGLRTMARRPLATLPAVRAELAYDFGPWTRSKRIDRAAMDAFQAQYGHLFCRVQKTQGGISRLQFCDESRLARPLAGDRLFNFHFIKYTLRVLDHLVPLPRGLDLFFSAELVDDSSVEVPVLSSAPTLYARGFAQLPHYHALLSVPKVAAEVSSQVHAAPAWARKADRLVWRGALNSGFSRSACGDEATRLPDELSIFDPRHNTSLRGSLPHSLGPCRAWTLALTHTTWELSPRCRAVLFSTLMPGDVDARFAPGWASPEVLAAVPLGTLRNLSHTPPVAHASFRYILQLGGVNFDSRRPFWVPFTGSVLFLQHGPFRSLWFRVALRPYVHYVPVSEDLSDLLQQLQWARSHQDRCRAMARRLRSFAERHFVEPTALLHYVLRAVRAYAERIRTGGRGRGGG